MKSEKAKDFKLYIVKCQTEMGKIQWSKLAAFLELRGLQKSSQIPRPNAQ
jgi:hypothetical protein